MHPLTDPLTGTDDYSEPTNELHQELRRNTGEMPPARSRSFLT